MKFAAALIVLLVSSGAIAGTDSNTATQDTRIDSVAAPSSSIINSNSVTNALPRMSAGAVSCDTPYIKAAVSDATGSNDFGAIISAELVMPINDGNCLKRQKAYLDQLIHGMKIEAKRTEVLTTINLYDWCAERQWPAVTVCGRIRQ